MATFADTTLDEMINLFRFVYDRDNFSRDGYAYLLGFYQGICPNEEIDVIAICCDWTEYYDEDELFQDYGYLIEGRDIDDLKQELDCRTSFFELPNGDYMVAAF